MSTATLDARREKKAEWNREYVSLGQEIGDVPKPESIDRKQRALEDFEFFCFTYFPDVSIRPWAEHHHIGARKMEQCATEGGLFAFAFPRGDLKTTLCRFKILQLALSGRSLYTILLCATIKAGEKRLDGIKTILATNKLLQADFPEVCYPIQKMDRSTRRCVGQKHNGEHTAMEWLANHIVLPTIPDSPASGARIESYGITGEIRGTDHALQDGRIVRPRVVFADDPQTHESAKSPSQTEYRERILASDVAYLNGPTEPVSIVMPCTVIREHDLADRMLDRQRHPEWRGERYKMMEAMPDNMKLWEQYENVLIDCHNSDEDTSKATAFYKKNRKKMDKGAKSTWEHRFNKNELSATQHAMNLYYRDRQSFFSEGQNDPVDDNDSLNLKSADELVDQFSGFDRYQFPATCQHITAFVDIQGTLLYYLVAAWDQDFTGYVIDYGAFPEQRRKYYTLRDARSTLKTKYPGRDQGGQIYAGLEDLAENILGRSWRRDDGADMRVSRMLIDAGWSESTKSVRLFARTSKYGNVVLPSHGRGIKASQLPMHEWQQWRKMRNPAADSWVIHNPKESGILSVTYDTNYWKKRMHESLALSKGDSGSLTLFSHPRTQRELHRMIVDQWLAERPVKTSANGRTVYEFHETPGRDNHLGDCMVGAMVAASICGVVRPHQKPKVRIAKKRRRKAKYLS